MDYTAQQQLRESDEQIRRIVTHSTDGIVLTDTDGRIILWSPAQERITGLAQEDAVGKYLWDVDFALSPAGLQTDDLLASLQRTTKALLQDGQPGGASLFDDDRIVDAAGNVRTIQRARYTFPSAAGHMLGCIMRDITGQKKTRDDLQRRVAELGLIYRASQAFASTLELDEVLRLVLQEVVQLLDVTGASIWLMDEEGGEFVARQSVGHSETKGKFVDASNLPTYRDLIQSVLASGQSLIVPDLRARVPDIHRTAPDEELPTRACLLTPLKIKDKVIGVLHLTDRMPHRFATNDVTLLESLAVPASIAVENARLFEEARVASELRERQRWIHLIHDLYNQSLFSASLIAEVLPQLWAQDPAAGAQAATDLRTLLRGALAEQRAAMLELRPADLSDANLAELLEQLAAGFEGRTNIPVRTAVDGDAVLPGDVRVVLYRICQEALSNVAKHADAQHVAIYLSRRPGRVTMRIADDGVGFEQETRAPKHLGLQVMQERAQEVGARLTITSHEDQGTIVEVCWTETITP
ncbi:MAG: GAF domain-containing protein [Caldilineaceae bacterium]